MDLRWRMPLTLIALSMLGCTSLQERHAINSMPRMGDSIKLAVASTPAPPAMPAASADPLAGLPAESAPPFALTAGPDPAAITRAYEETDFTFAYPAEWEPQPATAEDLRAGMVLKLYCEYEKAVVTGWSRPLAAPLTQTMGELAAATGTTRTVRTTLAGVTGFQVEGDAYAGGKRYFGATMGFTIERPRGTSPESRLVVIQVVYDRASKDREFLEQDLAKMLATWQWRHLAPSPVPAASPSPAS